MEFYLEQGLISEEGWTSRIVALRKASEERYGDEMVGCTNPAYFRKMWLAEFERAVLARAKGVESIGVLFSGGVDSTLIAFVLHKNGIPFTCYTTGFKDEGTKDPEDVVEAKRIVKHFGWKLVCEVLTLEGLEPIIKETALILGDIANPITVGVGAVVVVAAQRAKDDGVTVLFGGLGSEEIFAGYERHEKANDVNEECWNGLLAMHERDLLRDAAIAAALGISVPTPFLDLRVMEWAMYFPGRMKIVDGEKKHVLRVMAVEYGLPREYAFRPKRAAQYGSRVDSALEKLAKRHGLGKKEYVRSLLDQ